MSIRRANINDAKALSQLACTTFYNTFVDTCTANDMESFLHEYYNEVQTKLELENVNDFFYVYEINNKMVGYIRFKEDEPAFNELKYFKHIELKRLYILNEYHGKGVAKSLIEFCINESKLKRYNAMWLGVWEHNYKAQAFYKKHGFIETNYTHPFPIGNTPQTDVWYWKEI